MVSLIPWLDTGVKMIDKLVDRIPDPAARERATLEMQADLLKAAVAESAGQTEVNKIEAANPSLFVSGARPFIMWVCASAFAMNYVLFPIITWTGSFWGVSIPFPEMNMESMMTLLFGMLGLGSLRTYEKIKNVASK